MFYIIQIIFLSFFLLSCASKPQAKKETDKSKDPAAPAITVKVAPAFTGNLVLHIHAGGVCRANRRVDVALRQSGYIARLPVAEGAFVIKGQLLAMLDNGAQKIALSRARTALIKALAGFGVDYPNPDSAVAVLEKAMLTDISKPFSGRQLRELLSGKRQKQVQLAQSGVADAWDNYQSALLEYRQTFYRAPFAGYVADIKYRKGQWLAAATPLCTLVDAASVRIETEILENESGRIRRGATARVTLAALPGQTFTARVTEINPLIDPQKHTMRVTLLLKNKQGRIRPGMYARIVINSGRLKQRLLVPRSALVIRDNRELVFVVRDSLAQWCYVKTGARNDEYVEIVSSEFNLKPGEPVVTDGHFSLAHNALVRY